MSENRCRVVEDAAGEKFCEACSKFVRDDGQCLAERRSDFVEIKRPDGPMPVKVVGGTGGPLKPPPSDAKKLEKIRKEMAEGPAATIPDRGEGVFR